MHGIRTRSATAASNTVPQDARNTSTESTGEAEEDDDSSIYEDKNLEERQNEKKNRSNCVNLQVDKAKNGVGGAEINNSPLQKQILPEPSAQHHCQWSKEGLYTMCGGSDRKR